MTNRITQNKAGNPGWPAENGARPDPVAGQRAGSKPSDPDVTLKGRLLNYLGLPSPKPPPIANAPRFTQSPAALLPTTASRLSERPTVTSTPRRETTLLEQAIRARITHLPPADAQRYEGLLGHTLRTRDVPRQMLLYQMVKARQKNNEIYQRSIAPQAGLLQALTKTSVSVNFQGVVAEVSKKKEMQLLELRLGLLKMPTDLATRYQGLLREILARKDPERRDALIDRMARQVAERAKTPTGR